MKIGKTKIITPYGVGSIYETDGDSYVVKDIKAWRPADMQEIEIDAITSRLGRTRRIYTPDPDNFKLKVYRFPKWMFCPNQYCRRVYFLKPGDENRCRNPDCDDSKSLYPMRFVQICNHGHMRDVDWDYRVHRGSEEQGRCNPQNGDMKFETGSGGDFDQMKVICNCGAETTLEFIRNRDQAGNCFGNQPWEYKEPGESQNCELTMSFEPRGSSAIQYPSILSGLDISEGVPEAENFFNIDDYKTLVGQWVPYERPWGSLQSGVHALIEERLDNIASENDLDVADLLQDFKDRISLPDETEETDDDFEGLQLEILEEEFNILSSNHDLNYQNLKTKKVDISGFEINEYLDKLIRIESLTEVRVFRGFSRGKGEKIVPADLTGASHWLPGVSVKGEGIFLQLKESFTNAWSSGNEAQIRDRVGAAKAAFNQSQYLSKNGSQATPTFILLHTLSHLLIRQLAFECGYNTNSMRERLYCSHRKAAILIYTADSDSEGSLGGLQEMGKPSKFNNIFEQALEASKWCSSDPVCRESSGNTGMQALNNAACHSCCLLPETSCIFNNTLLDRVLLTGNPDENESGLCGLFNR